VRLDARRDNALLHPPQAGGMSVAVPVARP